MKVLADTPLVRISWIIVKNSYRSTYFSRSGVLFSILQPIARTAGFILLFSFITRPPGQPVAIFGPITTYFIFILIISSLSLDDYMDTIQESIYQERYLSINHLPINPIWYYLMSSLGANALAFGLLLAGALVYTIALGSSLAIIGLFIPAAIVTFLLAHALYFPVGLMAFYADNIKTYAFNIIFSFLSGQMFPLFALPFMIKALLFVLPFAYTGGAMASALSHQDTNQLILSMVLAMIWTTVLAWVGLKLWHHGSNYFQERG